MDLKPIQQTKRFTKYSDETKNVDWWSAKHKQNATDQEDKSLPSRLNKLEQLFWLQDFGQFKTYYNKHLPLGFVFFIRQAMLKTTYTNWPFLETLEWTGCCLFIRRVTEWHSYHFF